MAICMAQAYASSGDLGSARAELERLLATDTRDTQLLQQLSKLAEEEGDLESAARYQKQLNELAPSDDGASRLAQLYCALAASSRKPRRSGRRWPRARASRTGSSGRSTACSATRSRSPSWRSPRRWCGKTRTTGRRSTARAWRSATLDKPDRGRAAVPELLDCTTSATMRRAPAAKARSRDPKLQAASARPSAVGRQTVHAARGSRIGKVDQIRMACKLDNRVLLSSRRAGRGLGAGRLRPGADGGLGWLVSLAAEDKRGDRRRGRRASSARPARRRRPTSARSGTGSISCLLRYDNAAAFGAGKTLSQSRRRPIRWPSGPISIRSAAASRAGWASDTYVGQGSEAKDSTPPLEKAELDHVLACFASLRARRPELAQAQILQIVSTELKRAKRVEEEEQFYRESIAGATQLARSPASSAWRPSGATSTACSSSATATSGSRPGGRQQYYYTGTFYFSGTGLSICQGMSLCADRKAYDDVLRLLDHELAAARRRQERQSPGSRPSRPLAARLPGQRCTAVPDLGRQDIALYPDRLPLPNEYLDANRDPGPAHGFELYKRDDLMSDLVSHFRRRPTRPRRPPTRSTPGSRWQRSCGGTTTRTRRSPSSPRSPRRRRPSRTCGSTWPSSWSSRASGPMRWPWPTRFSRSTTRRMKRREELALRLSVLTGDLERARQAAERLFGLRLDTDTQVRLAGQMHQLGLHELAEAVLGRARRRAGNKATALVGLMLQYQRQGKLDVAVQVAMQILRSTTATRQTNPNVYYAEDPDASRAAAIGVLARSGRLARAHRAGQRAAQENPQLHQLHQALADYYKASGQRDKAPRRARQDRRAAARRHQPAAPGRPAARSGRPGRRGHRALQGAPQERPRHPRSQLLPGSERLPAGRQDRRADGPARADRPPPVRPAATSSST